MQKDFDLQNLRTKIRENKFTSPTAGYAPGYTQANLVILPKELAYDFLLFCQRNEKSCPLIEVTDTGSPIPKVTAPNADLRYDLPKYRIYKKGELIDEVYDIENYWRDDFVSFLIGCSFTFENPLIESGLTIRHIEENKNVPMYITDLPCYEAGMFHGNIVVSMRPFLPKDAIKAIKITSRFPSVHGSPIHIGNPKDIGIKNIESPDFGDSIIIKKGEVPVFWACGVTPQSVAISSKPDIMITHAPGYMFITDIKEEYYSIL